ncbi:carboxypeptidase N subunit 2-like [Achroia grisella]|uniref:carboxypeptidase N subunit 2-like n=1 Tax=Achroia grisella TaxID=688607 RepID=UPI0027D211EB|nr:carboxypeptidase N subunit 2-like [Achroia grisella]XP_059045461.1 carboxypeptidase N subunit 2-like [Achroia grisella]XP_059045462.1 carboxypeptidase N subunit 2-like [Achroia grisella]
MAPRLWGLIFILVTFASVQAKPKCTVQGDFQNDVICFAESSDYVLERGLVSDNNRTTRIVLKGCRIKDINNDSFHSLPWLEYLDLSVNSISNLEIGVFNGAPQLTSLNLSYNLITVLPLGVFDHNLNIELLDLRGNKIYILEQGLFDPLKKLKHLDLSSNLLRGKQLSPYIFDALKHIQVIDFSRNDMSDTSDLLLNTFQEVNVLNLDRCFLVHLPNFALKTNLRTMKQLIISTNQLSKLENSTAFVNLDSLEILNMADNKIDSIAGNIFVPLKKIKNIILRNNKLNSIPDNLFRDLPELTNLDLSHNLIEFVPVNAFRGAPLKNLNLSDNKFSYLTDNFCLELRNSGGKLKKIYFNDNPWQCACLFDFIAEVKRMGISYNTAKYNGQVKVCVMEQFSCQRQQSMNDLYVELYNNNLS